ncbi:hypothetical protein [Fictibacillus phosphorivorans]|uniref:hypothetical protein n=1 Tax=Fictibacillus phosphorivorans TaxID=1221500 RepID=UPI0035E6780E
MSTFEKLNNFEKKVVDLADVPSQSMTPADIKAWFDSSPEELRMALNKVVDALNANTPGWTVKTGDHPGTWQGLTPAVIGAEGMNASRITLAESKLENLGAYLDDFPFNPPESDADWSPRIQRAIDSGASIIYLPNRTINMASTVTGRSNLKIIGSPGTKIINQIPDALGTTKSLFWATGSSVLVGTTTAELTQGKNTVNVSTVSGLAVGDVICFNGDFLGRNISIIDAISGTTLTLDRPAANTIASGSNFHKITPVKDFTVENIHINFNGKYGFGVHVDYGQNCSIKNIKSENIGSRVAQFTRTFDSIISNVSCIKGFSNSDGGHSYLVRLSVTNDCVVEKAIGSRLRHVVDLSGASRNTVRDCEGYYNASSDFLTHANGAKNNLFINNKSISNQTSAYSFSPYSNAFGTGGDTGNMVKGGYVEGSPIIYWDQDGSNIIEGVTYKVVNAYGITYNGTFNFKQCHFILDYTLVNAQTTDTFLNFENCTFEGNVIRGLASLGTNINKVEFNFIGGRIKMNVEGGNLLEGGSNTTINVLNAKIKVVASTQNFPLFLTDKEIKCKASYLEFDGAGGISFFGIRNATVLYIDGNTFVNCSAIWRTYTSNTGSVKFGNNILINSTYAGVANLINMETAGLVNIGVTSAPQGTWVVGKSSVLNSNPAASGYAGWVYTSTGWKGFGTIQA